VPSTDATRNPLPLALIGLAIAAVLVASVFSCSHSEPTLRPAPAPSTTASSSTTSTTAPGVTGTVATPPSTDLGASPARLSRVATVREGVDEVPVHESASSTGPPSQVLPAEGDYGQRQVFLVIESEGPRLHVRLPVRPNGSSGWIDADLVEVQQHDYQIQVSLSGFEMVVQRGEEVVLETAIGVGTEDTPTIGGEFYTWVLIDPTNAGYGSYAYGLSGFSSLEQFAGGDGRMGIHGTDDDSSIGRKVSHGCIRVPDEVVVELVEEVGLPLGVPVTITA
jgi:lipoprotein-anchoring transpeptidase ErfK/SrfK